MPLYDYQCLECGDTKEYLLDMEHEAPVCRCGGKMAQIYRTPHYPTVSFHEGYDIGAGRHFSTEKQRDGWLKDNKLRRIRS